MKECRDCGVIKPLMEFHKHADMKDGRASFCKPCANERVRAGRARNPEMYERQKREAVASARQRFENDPEPKRAYERAYYHRNADKRRAKNRESYQRNKEAYVSRARARTASLVRCLAADFYAEIVRRDPCSYCGGSGGTVDHIVPIKVNGEHVASNLTGACDSCNKSKQTHTPLHFLLNRPGHARWRG